MGGDIVSPQEDVMRVGTGSGVMTVIGRHQATPTMPLWVLRKVRKGNFGLGSVNPT